MTVVRDNRTGRFVVGHPGGPGRPIGKRNYLSESVLAALAEDFSLHGKAAIERVRTERPHHYLSVLASLCPRQLNVERTSPFSDLSDQEVELLEQFLRANRAQLVPEIEPNGQGNK